jgi:Crp-like helix-turn-helix domain
VTTYKANTGKTARFLRFTDLATSAAFGQLVSSSGRPPRGSGRFNAIPLTQDFLAQMLGVRRTTVNATASLLQSGGVIRYHRGRIQIVDRAALEDMSCECYAVVRHKIDKIFPPARFEIINEPVSGKRAAVASG